MKLSNLDEQTAQDGLVGIGFEDEIVPNDKTKMFIKGKATKDKVSSWQID